LRSYRVPVPVLLQGTRGCYWGKCAFCIHTAGVHSYQRKAVRVRPLDMVLDDIDLLVKKYNPHFVVFADVSMAPAICRKLSEAFIKRNYKFGWFIFLRFEEDFNEDLLMLMDKARCKMLNFGLESGSQRILDNLEKGFNLDTAERILHTALKFNFKITIHTMAGLPGETLVDLQKTIEIVRKFIPHVYESWTEVFRLERDTRIYRDPAHFEVSIAREKRIFDNAICFKNNKGISTDEALQAINHSLYSFYNGRNDLIYATKSQAGFKAKDSFVNASIFSAKFSVKYKDQIFNDCVRISTRGGGILTKLSNRVE
jgi:anaerobic magnesium-protoporphyrin IX monomethyl ester cyclase